MKMIFKSLIIMLLTMVIGAACDCDSTESRYKIVELKVEELEGGVDSKTGELNFSNSFTLNSSDTIKTFRLGYLFSPEIETIASTHLTGFFNSAFADCSEGSPSPSQKFSTINITSSNAYITADKTYAAGESLNEVFTSQAQSGASVEDGIINNYVFDTDFILMLKVPPTGRQPHQFTFTFTLDDGSEFDMRSETLMLEP